jgi:hypothetical protein
MQAAALLDTLEPGARVGVAEYDEVGERQLLALKTARGGVGGSSVTFVRLRPTNSTLGRPRGRSPALLTQRS